VQKKASLALQKLEPLADRLAGNPEFDYVYGVASLDCGRPAQAATALRRAVEANPNFMKAHAELGRSLAAMGDLTGAKREFEVVQASGEVPPSVRNVVGQQITAIDQASLTPKRLDEGRTAAPVAPSGQSATRITGYFEASLGYDTNVNGGPTSNTLLIPAFSFLGPASLSPNSLSKKSAFYELGGGASIVHAFSNDLAAFANVVGNWHMLTENQEFRSDLIGLETGVARQVAGVGIFSIAAVGQAFSIGDNTYRNAYGLAAQWRNKIDGWGAEHFLHLAPPGVSSHHHAGCGSLHRRDRARTHLRSAVSTDSFRGHHPGQGSYSGRHR
jgi:outer membrane protein